jgi:hypothetical protein
VSRGGESAARGAKAAPPAAETAAASKPSLPVKFQRRTSHFLEKNVQFTFSRGAMGRESSPVVKYMKNEGKPDGDNRYFCGFNGCTYTNMNKQFQASVWAHHVVCKCQFATEDARHQVWKFHQVLLFHHVLLFCGK